MKIILIFLALLFLTARYGQAGDISNLADCSIRIFKEINKTKMWSDKKNNICRASIAVEKREEGIYVTTWRSRQINGGWTTTALSSAMGYHEVANLKQLNRAAVDIKKRSTRINRCLESIIRSNDPLECRDRAVKSYMVGEATGIENRRLIWLEDDGRHIVAEYSYGTTTATPSPPADLMNGDSIPAGMVIDLHIKR